MEKLQYRALSVCLFVCLSVCLYLSVFISLSYAQKHTLISISSEVLSQHMFKGMLAHIRYLGCKCTLCIDCQALKLTWKVTVDDLCTDCNVIQLC